MRHRPRLSLLAVVVTALTCCPTPNAAWSQIPPGLAELAPAVQSADYRGDRAELSRLAGRLEIPGEARLEAYRQYWRAFAWWRRGINGFNETPTPDDLLADFECCAAAFRAALAIDPAFEDARSGLAGCLGGQMALVVRLTPERRQAVLEEGVPLWRSLDATNPRSLWILGGMRLAAPPPSGGNPEAAAELYHRGLEAVRAELRVAGSGPVWMPRWGGPELLMSLAYLHSHGATPNREAAKAYALGALAGAPEWHYVRDILLPQIEALP